jgi:hypothetical protein
VISAETYSFYKSIYETLTYLWLVPWVIGSTVVGAVLSYFKLLRTEPLDRLLSLIVGVDFFLLIAVALSHLFYPGYLEHVEPSIASLGLIYLQKGQIYPPLSEYSMHGLMYGPLLAEAQALFGAFNLPVIFSSKLLGVAAFIFSSIALLRMFTGFARAYLIFLIPFGLFNFWNRAEPLIILLVTLALLVMRQPVRIKTSIVLGGLVGLAASLKIHAASYVIAAIFTRPDLFKGWTVQKGLVFLAAIFLVLIASHTPQQISIFGFVSYLDLFRKHGLSSILLLENLTHMLVLVFPILYLLLKGLGKNSKYLIPAVLLVAVEFIVAMIASKPGAGSHHLMPFIPLHALIIQGILDETPTLNASILPFKFGLLILGLVTLIAPLILAGKHITRYSVQSELKKEVELMAERYPGVVLAPSDVKNYPHVYFRPMLDAKGYQQIDIPGAMELNFSKVPDDVLVAAMSNCRIPYLALPVEGEPFTLLNYYTMLPLFSDNVRSTFQKHYSPVTSRLTKHYTVYSCAVRD